MRRHYVVETIQRIRSAVSTSSAVATTPRTSIGLPAERADQLRSLATARGITTTALIESWINRAIREKEPGAVELPGYGACRIKMDIIITIAGRTLPLLDELAAYLLSTVLDGAAGTLNPPREFKMDNGKAVTLPVGNATLVVGRQGRGVVFALTDHKGKTEKFAAPSSYITDLARAIREAIKSD